jgi:hypothetical protein
MTSTVDRIEWSIRFGVYKVWGKPQQTTTITHDHEISSFESPLLAQQHLNHIEPRLAEYESLN